MTAPDPTFDEWLVTGVRLGYASEGFCETHDMAPMTDAEVEQFEEGLDPCIPAVRVYPGPPRHNPG